MPRVADLIAELQRLAPTELAEEWDNVGLLLGDRDWAARRVLTCLTLTPDVAREAIEQRASLVVTHHPVLFRPVQRLTADDPQGRMLLELAAARSAVYSPHTGYDSAQDGINRQLADLLALADVAPLRPTPGAARCKIVCFVPREHLERVQEALWSAGAGVIGEYSKCSFVLDGTGSFLGSGAANPAVGKAEQFEQVAEARLEVVCPRSSLPDALRRLRGAHPYEEPAYDVYSLEPDTLNCGAGRLGLVSPPLQRGGRPMCLAEFIQLVKEKLHLQHLQFVGDPGRAVSRVGICCGSGGELLSAAVSRGCDVFLTGEARFHTCLEARAAGIALVLAGHYATERPAMERLAEMLKSRCPDLDVTASRVESDPLEFA